MTLRGGRLGLLKKCPVVGAETCRLARAGSGAEIRPITTGNRTRNFLMGLKSINLVDVSPFSAIQPKFRPQIVFLELSGTLNEAKQP